MGPGMEGLQIEPARPYALFARLPMIARPPSYNIFMPSSALSTFALVISGRPRGLPFFAIGTYVLARALYNLWKGAVIEQAKARLQEVLVQRGLCDACLERFFAYETCGMQLLTSRRMGATPWACNH